MAGKKESPEKPEDQSRKLVEEAQKLIDAGELNPIDAERRLDRLVAKSRPNIPHERQD